MSVPHTVSHSGLLQHAPELVISGPALFPYRNCAEVDGCAVLLLLFNYGAEETKQSERSDQIS